MKRLIMVATVLIMIAMTLPLNAQNSIYPSSLTWLAGETDTKEVQINTTGHWSCDSTLYSNHFSVTPQSGNGSGYLYVTPLSVNSGEEAIEGVAELSVNGTPLLLNMLHSAPTPPVPILDVSPPALSWTFDGTEQQTIYVTTASGTWDYSLSGSGFSCTRSGSTLLVQPTCWDHGDSPHTAAIAFSSGGATSSVSLVQAANPYVSGVTDTNYIQKTTFTNAGGISSYRDVTYFDGLGYEVQGIAVGGSPSGKSVVNQTVYDAMRRPDAMLYLPYSRGDAGASLSSESASLSSQLAFYGNLCGDVHPWSQKEYGSSSAGRVKSVRREGDAWSAAEGRKMTLSYLGNTSADAVMKFSFMPAQGDGCAVAVYAPSDQYGDGALRKMRSRDEEGAVSEIFTDGAGRTVCVRSWSGTGGTETASDTYYVYDLWDRLVLVIQPEATTLLLGKPASQRNIPLFGGEGSMNADIFDDWCFAWRYDGTGNLVMEHTPGGGTALYAYDARDRQVLRTDARMRPDGDTGPRRMVFTQYDQYDRIVEERYVFSPRAYWETLSSMIRDTVSHTMSPSFIESYLPTLQTLRSAEYFPFGSVSYATTGDGAFVPETGIVETADLETVRIKGLLKKETLYPAPAVDGTIPAGAPSVTRYYHYDYLGRVIQSKEVWSDGRTRRVSTKYSFTGDILATKETVSVTVEGTGELESSLATFYTRDPRGRVLSCSRVLNGTDTLATVHYSYDDLGRLVGKSVGNVTNPALKADYAYDLHDWATGIDVSVTDGVGSGMDTVFSETLRYATAEKDNNAKRYDGNISETAFSHRIVPSSGSPYLQTNTWSYAYDGLKRLTDANHYPGAALTPSLTDTERSIAYDRNGNITALKRYGNAGLENDLSFTHTGNRMTALADANGTGASAGTKSFSYDANGNLTHDGRKDLDLSWNLLNLVCGAVMHGSDNNTEDSSLTYAWLSDGTKVSAVAEDGNGNGVQKRYLGSFVYTSTSGSSAEPPMEVESIAWDEGRIFFNFPEEVDSMGVVDTPVGEEAVIDSLIVVDTAVVAGWFRDCWFAADHLGNVRAVIDINPDLVLPEILEQNDYLPYGTRIQNSAFATATDNRWRYAGKEEQRFGFGSAAGSLNLSLLDFGARMYDPFTARWTAVDPIAKNTSTVTPYAYCTDNSINRFDPDGNAVHIAIGAFVGAAIEGGIAIYQGKSTREVSGAMVRGAIEGGVIAATLGVGTGAAIAYGAAASAAGSIADQAISNGSIDAKQVLIDTAVGSVSSGLGELSNAGVKKATTKIMTNIEDKYASSATKDMYRNEIKKELKSEGKHVRNEKLNQMVKNRIDVNSKVDKTLVDASDKVLRYSVELIYDTSLNQLENIIYERP